MRTEDAFSPGLIPGQVIFTLVMFGLIYSLLVSLKIFLIMLYGRKGPGDANDRGQDKRGQDELVPDAATSEA